MSNLEALFQPVKDLVDTGSKIDDFYRTEIEQSLLSIGELNNENKRDLENLAFLMLESGNEENWDLFDQQLDSLRNLSLANITAQSQVSQQSKQGQAQVKKSVGSGVSTPAPIANNQKGGVMSYLSREGGEVIDNVWEGLNLQVNKIITPEIIKEIKISGEIGKGEAIQRKERFRTELVSNPELEKLKPNDRAFIIEQLTEIIDAMANEKGFALGHINGYFNGLAKSVHEKGGKWYVELSRDSRESLMPAFDSKEEALEAIKKMKSDAEGRFEKMFDDVGVSTFTGIVRGYISMMSVPYDMFVGASESSIGNAWSGLGELTDILPGGESFEVFGMALDGIQSAVWGFVALSIAAAVGTVHSGAIDTVYRRLIKDPFSMINERLQFENYAAKGPGFIAPSIDQPGGKDYFEYMQRQSLMDQLYVEFEANFSPGTKEYDAFKKELASLERYKLNKTPTFYYKAYQLIEFHDKGFVPRSLHKLYSFFVRGGVVWRPDWLWDVQKDERGNPLRNAKGNKIREFNKVPFAEITRFADDQILYSKIMLALNAKEDSIRNGLNDFYSHVETSGEDISSFKVLTQNANPDTPLYEAIVDEINARDLPEKKKTELLDRFNKLIKSLPQRYRTQELLARELYYLLEKDYADKGKASKLITDEIDDVSKGQSMLQQAGERADKISRRNNSVANRLRAFEKLIQSGEWVGTEKEVKDAIESIKTTDFNVKENIVARGLPDNGDKTQYLDWYSDYQDRIDDASKNRALQKARYFESNDVKQYKGEAKLVDNYIKYMSASSLEESAQKEFDAMMKLVFDGKLFIQNGTLFREANLIVQGFLPMYVIRDLHAKVDSNNIRTPDGRTVYDQIGRALSSGSEIHIPQTLIQDLSRLGTLRDATPFNSVTSPSSTVDFTAIDGLGDYDDFDMKRALGVDRNDQVIAKLAHISEYIDILHGEHSTVSTEFGRFISSLKTNAYTLSQAKYIMTQLITGENFADVDYVTHAGHDSRDNLNSLADTLGREFDSRFAGYADLEGKIGFYEAHVRTSKSNELKDKFTEVMRVMEDEINEIEDLRTKKAYYERLRRSSPEGFARTQLTTIIGQLDSDIKDEGKKAEIDAEKARKAAQDVEQDRNTLQSYVKRLDDAQTLSEIETIEKQYHDLMGTERGSRLNADEFETERGDIIDRINSMKRRFDTASGRSSWASGGESPDIADDTAEDLRSRQKAASDYLDSIVSRLNTMLETMTTEDVKLGDMAQEIENLRTHIQGSIQSGSDEFLTINNIDNYFVTRGGISKIPSEIEVLDHAIRIIGMNYDRAIRYANLMEKDDIERTLTQDKATTLSNFRMAKTINEMPSITIIRSSILANLGLTKFPTDEELDELKKQKTETRAPQSVEKAAIEDIDDTVAQAEEAEEIPMEVLRAKFDELRELNDRVSFELMMKYEGEELKAKLQELTTFINHANNQDNFKELLRENDDFVPFFKEKFGIDEIRPKRKLQEKIRAAKEKLPDDLPRNFTDIAERIRNVTDVSAMGSIAEAFKNVNISR